MSEKKSKKPLEVFKKSTGFFANSFNSFNL